MIEQKGSRERGTPFVKALAMATGLTLISALPIAARPVNAREGVDQSSDARIALTPSEGSVTPQASGDILVEVLSKNNVPNLVELRLGGNLSGLVAGRDYGVWVCLASGSDCSSHATPKIIADENGKVSFEDLEVTIFDRDSNPVSSVKVVENTAGPIPSDSCYLPSAPCLESDYSIPAKNF